MSSKRPIRARPSYTNLFVPDENGGAGLSSGEGSGSAQSDSDHGDGDSDRDDGASQNSAPRRRSASKEPSSSAAKGKKRVAAPKRRLVRDSSDESAFDPEAASDAEIDVHDGDSESAVSEGHSEDGRGGSDSDLCSIVGSRDGGQGEDSPGSRRKKTAVSDRPIKGRGTRPSTNTRGPRKSHGSGAPVASTLGAALAAIDHAPKKGTRLIPWDRNLTHNEQMQPLWRHFTTHLLEPPAMGRRSRIQRADDPEMELGEMRKSDMSKRVRVVTKEAYSMTPWEGWGGEPWRPKGVGSSGSSSGSKWKGKAKEIGWAGIEGAWEGMEVIDLERALPHLVCPPTAAGFSLWTGHLSEHFNQTPSTIPVNRSQSLESLHIRAKKGVLFNPGGPVISLDWCPMPEAESERRGFRLFLAVAAHPALDSPLSVGHSKPPSTPGSIQIWSVGPAPNRPGSGDQADGVDAMDIDGPIQRDDAEPGEAESADRSDWDLEMKLEMVVCVQGGFPWQLRWSPIVDPDQSDSPGTIPKLGVLAATMEDGSLQVFAIPDPDAIRARDCIKTEDPSVPDQSLYVYLQRPLARVDLEEGLCSSLDWGSERDILIGTSNGLVQTYDILEVILASESDPLPLVSIQAQQSPIYNAIYLRGPSFDASGRFHRDAAPTLVISTATNGRTVVTDLNDGSAGGGEDSSSMIRISRGTSTRALTFSPTMGSPVVGDLDYQAYAVRVRALGYGRESKIATHQGMIWGLSCSDFHSSLASCSADGSVILTNMSRGTTKNRTNWVTLMENVYKLDLNEETGELRMIDNILSQNTINTKLSKAGALASPKLSKKNTDRTFAARELTPAFSPRIGVLAVSWCNGTGLGRAGLLATGMACGLARIDVCDGQWKNGRITPGELAWLR